MRFNYDGIDYVIEFQRELKPRKIQTGRTLSRVVMKRYPDTTVRILKSSPGALPGEVYREATVGCSVHDQFTLERGRIAALRAVSRTLETGFKQALWYAYLTRKTV